MKKTSIIYWSSTGHTEKMARLIQKGLLESEANMVVDVKHVRDAHEKDLIESDFVLLGSPAMGVEEIDSSEMMPFITANKLAFAGKSVGLFGSYGWGDGEWMEDWEAMMKDLGAKLRQESLMVCEAPEGDAEQDCIKFGKVITQIVHSES